MAVLSPRDISAMYRAGRLEFGATGIAAKRLRHWILRDSPVGASVEVNTRARICGAIEYTLAWRARIADCYGVRYNI